MFLVGTHRLRLYFSFIAINGIWDVGGFSLSLYVVNDICDYLHDIFRLLFVENSVRMNENLHILNVSNFVFYRTTK